MKKNFAFLLTLLLFNSIFASNEISVKPELNSVKVFQNGAELFHNAKVKVDKGITDIFFRGLADKIDVNSVNVSAKGDAVILAVVQRFDYLSPQEKSPKIIMLEDSLEILSQKIQIKQNEIEVLKTEIDLLFANKEIGSKDKGVSVAELQKMAEYFSKRLNEIKSQQLSFANVIKKTEKEIDRIKKQLEELNNKLNQPTNELIVTVSAKNQSTVEFDLSYITYQAGWHPVYDIRVAKLNQPANLSYRANVWQNCGLEWNDVNLILSTRNPWQNNTKPNLFPWFIDFERNSLRKGARGEVPQSITLSPLQMQAELKVEEDVAPYFAVDVEQKQLSVEFTPSIKYTIPSDGKQHTAVIQDYTLNASYEYYAAPKFDNNAFLVAYLTEWNNFNLLPGETHIYFENSYVGKSFINPFTSKDTLTVSLGSDRNISVTKETLKDFTEQKFLSRDVERIFGYEIKIKNNKNIPVKILVEEQIPLSKNEEIEVKLIDHSGGVYTSEDGKIKWNVSLDGNKSETKKLVYSVRYPKDKTIIGL